MYTLPKSLTAAIGLDALAHAIEGLITKEAWEMSNMFEIKAIEMIASIGSNLRHSSRCGKCFSNAYNYGIQCPCGAR